MDQDNGFGEEKRLEDLWRRHPTLCPRTSATFEVSPRGGYSIWLGGALHSSAAGDWVVEYELLARYQACAWMDLLAAKEDELREAGWGMGDYAFAKRCRDNARAWRDWEREARGDASGRALG